MSQVKRLIIAAASVALCVVLPMAFHSVPNAGSIFLPMHIPVLLCGLICGWSYGLACGILGPLLSSLMTGMPPMAYLPSMMCEMGVYGLMAGLLFQVVRTKNVYVDLYASLLGAMLTGRVVYGILNALIFRAGEYSMAVWTTSAFVTSLPGIIIQVVIIPLIMIALMRSKLIPQYHYLTDLSQQIH